MTHINTRLTEVVDHLNGLLEYSPSTPEMCSEEHLSGVQAGLINQVDGLHLDGWISDDERLTLVQSIGIGMRIARKRAQAAKY